MKMLAFLKSARWRWPLRLGAPALAALGGTALAGALQADQAEFFEKQIRPVLVERCYECHNSIDKKKGGLALDWKGATEAGGESGPAVVPGKPGESRLIRAIQHQDSKLKMPRAGPKLSDAVVHDFERWIEMGAPDPRDRAPSAQELARSVSWEATRTRRLQWWSFQPIQRPALPDVRNADWAGSEPVDRFVLARLEAAGLQPAPRADRPTLIRRVTFTLTGLPPTPDEIASFLRDQSPRAYEVVVDRLLASPRFGECWARHWMDWIRYSESHGSEGDPPIPYAWRYRDYLIRALNSDVPYDRMVREHIAGDLLPDPRVDAVTGINESALATAHYRMVQHGYAPTDALEEQITFTDNQIDVISKAFMGLTVSCARCHDHKFDPVSQADFYALYGIMASSRPGLITVGVAPRDAAIREKLVALKGQIRQRIAEAWLTAADQFADRLLDSPQVSHEEGKGPPPDKNAKKPGPPAMPSGWQETIDETARLSGHSPLHAWLALRNLQGDKLKTDWQALAKPRDTASEPAYRLTWNLAGGDTAKWSGHGTGLGGAAAAGGFAIASEGPGIVDGVYPAGVYSHLLSSKDSAVLQSPRFKIDTDEIFIRMNGGGGAKCRLVVDNYPRFDGPTYPSVNPECADARWHAINTSYWKGEWAYLEITTAADLPLSPQMPPGRSWFGVTQVVGRAGNEPGPVEPDWQLPEMASLQPPADVHELARYYGVALHDAVIAWREGTMSAAQATLVGYLARRDLLPNRMESLADVAPLVKEYRELEAALAPPVRSPGVFESAGFDQPLFIRGDHKQQAAAVHRRFIEAIDPADYQSAGSGRLQLADSLVSPRNPLAARVIANRLWKHVFGEGIVATVDNFGLLGEEPSNPRLLDYLAGRMIDDGWSIKRAVRRMVLSNTYRMSSDRSPESARQDPGNRMISHMGVRRLEAEAIRDSLLSVSGGLDGEMYGPPVDNGSKRRSIYLAVQRNRLNPFLAAFDAPAPFTTQGRREVTNVPAQSLALLNDPFVIEQAERWAAFIVHNDAGTDERIDRMFNAAFARIPAAEERSQVREYLSSALSGYGLAPNALANDIRPWRDLALSFFNMKEFIYLR